jgi:hypothetical protein
LKIDMQEANKHGSSTPSGVRRLRITEPATDRPMASLVLATLTNDPQTALAMRTADPEALTAEMLAPRETALGAPPGRPTLGVGGL